MFPFGEKYCKTLPLNSEIQSNHLGEINMFVWCISYSEWSERRMYPIAIALQRCFGIWYEEGSRKLKWTEIEWGTSVSGISLCC
jgi:hypothetical protein